LPRKKAELVAPTIEADEAAPLRKVHVRENTVRTYDTVEADAPEDDDPPEIALDDEERDVDPLHEFLSSVSADEGYLLKVYVLPSYFVNGKVGSKVEDIMFVTQFSFGPDEINEYENIVKGAYNWTATPGGRAMFEFQLLRRGGTFKRRWNKAITAPLPGHVPQQQASYPVIVNQPPAPPPPDPVRPIETVKEQMSVIKTMVDLVDAIRPPQPAPRNGNEDGGTIGEKIALALLSRPDSPLERVVEVLNAGAPKSTGWLDAFIEYAPHVGPHVGQGINAMLMALARKVEIGNQQAAQQQPAHQPLLPQSPAALPSAPSDPAQPVETASADATATAEGPSGESQQPNGTAAAADAAQPQAPPTRQQIFEYAYRKAIQRVVEDCIEQVQLCKMDPLTAPTLPTKPAGETVYALTERFDPEGWPEENAFLMQMLNINDGKLLTAEPVEVLVLCASAAPNERVASLIMGLTQEPAALKWIELLQKEIRNIIEEAKEQEEAGE
jgi:hypothetical protein